MGTNRQLRAETQVVAHKLNSVPYTLDVVFVKNVGLMPTWLSFPLWQKHIDTLRVNFRIFDDIGDVDETFPWFDKEMKCEGDERTSSYFNIMVLLSCYILNLLEDPVHDGTGIEVPTSPEDRDYESEYRTIAPYTIRNIIIDITGPELETYEKSIADPGNVNHCKFGDDIFDRDDLWPFHLPMPEGKLELAHYLASDIFGTLDMMRTSVPFAGYGKLWYQNMGDFEIRVNGQDWDKVDGTYAFCTSRYMRSLLCSEEGHANPEDFDETREILERRRQGGFWNESTFEQIREDWD
ncbi:hypothetical protein Neosp_012133 [[Neocosmospora] mangrovei]